MTKIYQTDDLEGALRQCHQRNSHVVLYQKHNGVRKIPIRTGMISALPLFYILNNKHTAEANKLTIKRWEAKGGILRYIPMKSRICPPKCDAMVFVECPLSYKQFKVITSNVNREIIVYRPPSWDIHEEAINLKFPTKQNHEALYNCFQFNRRPYNCHMATSEVIKDQLGLSEARIERLLPQLGKWRKLIQFKLLSEPQDNQPMMRAAYEMLKICAGRIDAKDMTTPIKNLMRYKRIKKISTIYLLEPFAEIDDSMDIKANMKRSEWYQLRNLIDRVEPYPLHQSSSGVSVGNSHTIQSHTHDVLSR